MGQVGTGVARELQHVNQVMGSVQGSLGKLGEVTQRVFDIGKDIAGLEQILRSPKVRGGLGESFLEGLLGQMLPREHYDLQHTFATGDRVDAVVRIGGRLVPIDAKFPLENFRRLLDETDEDKRRALRRAFGRDVKARVDEIAKRYILPDEGTFDFALMYIPAENVYYEIIVKDDGRGGRLARRPTRWGGTSFPSRRTASTRTCKSSCSASGACRSRRTRGRSSRA